MKEETIPSPVSPALEKQLRELLKNRIRNTTKLGQTILKAISERPGGLNDKNSAIVFDYLIKTFSFTKAELIEYVRIGRGLLLPELRNMTSRGARLAAELHIDDQRALVFDGVEVVVDLEEPPVKMRLHQMSDFEAVRVIDPAVRRIRNAKQQRQLMQTIAPPTPRETLLRVWRKNRSNTWVKIAKRITTADFIWVAEELKKLELPSISDPAARSRLEKDLRNEFPPPQGASPE